jgi:16S rRNA (uracil1498-N3)-methyltransferase
MPGSIRLYLPAPLHAGAELTTTPAQAHYLANVMRCAVGETLRLFNGRDGEWEARIRSLRRDRALLVAERQVRPQAPEPDLWLLFAPLKRDATDLVVEKATELGAAAILPVLTDRTNTARMNPTRLLAIATEAAEQCERLTLPRIAPPEKLSAILAGWPTDRPLVAALERSVAPKVQPAQGPAALLVGPEGGFTEAELDALRRHPLVVAASLGPRILRAETAVIVGLALLQAPLLRDTGGG